jgi:uncharacterized protein (TIGR02246 family)
MDMARADVETGEKAWLKAFNGGDAAGVAARYTDAGRLMAPNAETVEGRGNIEGFTKEFIATGAQLSFELLSVHESADMCASVGRYVMTFPGDAPEDRGKFIEVWTRQADGSWLIADDIFNSDLPPATA